MKPLKVAKNKKINQYPVSSIIYHLRGKTKQRKAWVKTSKIRKKPKALNKIKGKLKYEDTQEKRKHVIKMQAVKERRHVKKWRHAKHVKK